MPYRYTGQASEFRLPGDPKVYKNGDIVPISKADALHMSQYSHLHSFEIVNSGEDLMDAVTAPEAPKEGKK